MTLHVRHIVVLYLNQALILLLVDRFVPQIMELLMDSKFLNKDMLQVQIDQEKQPRKTNHVEHFYLINDHHVTLIRYSNDATNDYFIK